MISVVLFDLDGVIRHFDPAPVSDIEVRYGLQPGALAGIAFAAPLIDEVTTGRITRVEWISRIGHLVGDQAAAEEWGAQTWSVDDAPGDFVRAQLRAIVGVELPITRLEGKRKLSQNRPADDVAGAIVGLTSGTPTEQAVAGLMAGQAGRVRSDR